jgi:thiamine biosynthesis lipoprotein
MSPNARKNSIYSLVLLGLVLVVYLIRSFLGGSSNPAELARQKGLVTAQGAFMEQDYLFLYYPEKPKLPAALDSLLIALSQQFLMDSPRSEIYQLNQQDSLANPSKALQSLLKAVIQDSKNSEQVWDPSSGILYQAWNFSSTGASLKDSSNVPALLEKVGVDNILISDSLLRKTVPGIKIDLRDYGSALALAQVGKLLEQQGIQNYFLKLGRHTLAKGVNEKKELWKAKTNYPDSLARNQEGLIALQNKALASSGDFSRFYQQDSVKKSWLLDPRTGYPVNHGLLRATVLAKDSKTAALLSETLMIRGWREAMKLDSARKDVEMILVYHQKGQGISVYASPELTSFLSFPIK